jgi:hypothetical protein
LIQQHLNRNHTKIQLNWTEGVAYRKSAIFSTNFKETWKAEQTILEVDFGQSNFVEPGEAGKIRIGNFL